MKLLLDTHVLLWALLEPQKLSLELRHTLENSDNTLVVSAASAWEIATKWRLGKLRHARSVVENYAMACIACWRRRLRWMAFIGQFWSLTSLTPGGRNRVRFQCRPLGEFCLPESCVALHGSTSKESGPG